MSSHLWSFSTAPLSVPPSLCVTSRVHRHRADCGTQGGWEALECAFPGRAFPARWSGKVTVALHHAGRGLSTWTGPWGPRQEDKEVLAGSRLRGLMSGRQEQTDMRAVPERLPIRAREKVPEQVPLESSCHPQECQQVVW